MCIHHGIDRVKLPIMYSWHHRYAGIYYGKLDTYKYDSNAREHKYSTCHRYGVEMFITKLNTIPLFLLSDKSSFIMTNNVRSLAPKFYFMIYNWFDKNSIHIPLFNWKKGDKKFGRMDKTHRLFVLSHQKRFKKYTML